MTARVIQDAGHLFIEADLFDFHAAGMFLAFRGAQTPVRMGHTNPADAQRLADRINTLSRDKAALLASRAYAEHMERGGQ